MTENLAGDSFPRLSNPFRRVWLELPCNVQTDYARCRKYTRLELPTRQNHKLYQIKKLQIKTQSEANRIYAELKLNFDSERLDDGHVVLIIDDISKEVKQFLINMEVQSISKDEVLNLAANFNEPEDRQKVLRVVSDEFGRDYLSRIS